MALAYEKRQLKRDKERYQKQKERLMAYGTYVLLKWYVNYVNNKHTLPKKIRFVDDV
jgi:hypothetical protein